MTVDTVALLEDTEPVLDTTKSQSVIREEVLVDDESDTESISSSTGENHDENIVPGPDLNRQNNKIAWLKHLQKKPDSTQEAGLMNENAISSLQADSIKGETGQIIDQVRDYQQELFERAKEENIIAVYGAPNIWNRPTN